MISIQRYLMCETLLAEVEEMKRQMEEQMAANQRELEEMKKSYQERMKEGQADAMVGV